MEQKIESNFDALNFQSFIQMNLSAFLVAAIFFATFLIMSKFISRPGMPDGIFSNQKYQFG
jgi:hypothetical protein